MFPLWGLGGLSCSDDDDTPNCQGIDCLPEATQTGAGTFGCLVNGEPFYAFGSVDCQYQLVNGEYFFGVGFSRGCCFPYTIDLATEQLEIEEGETYNLLEINQGNAYGYVAFFFDSDNSQFITATTSEEHSGTITITKLDQQNKIVAGTFEFEILNPDDSQVYQITEGRFDSFYAQ
jgi:hypothetical protein